MIKRCVHTIDVIVYDCDGTCPHNKALDYYGEGWGQRCTLAKRDMTENECMFAGFPSWCPLPDEKESE